MTNRTCFELHLDLTCGGRAQLDLFNNKGGAEGMADGGFDFGHCVILT
jgi:hypothetical protein